MLRPSTDYVAKLQIFPHLASVLMKKMLLSHFLKIISDNFVSALSEKNLIFAARNKFCTDVN